MAFFDWTSSLKLSNQLSKKINDATALEKEVAALEKELDDKKKKLIQDQMNLIQKVVHEFSPMGVAVSLILPDLDYLKELCNDPEDIDCPTFQELHDMFSEAVETPVKILEAIRFMNETDTAVRESLPDSFFDARQILEDNGLLQ